jgi:hypothetical protein
MFCNEQRLNARVMNTSFSLQGKQVTQNAKQRSICVPAQCTQAIIAS